MTEQPKAMGHDEAASDLITVVPRPDGRVLWTSAADGSEYSTEPAALPICARLLLVVPGEEVLLDRIGFVRSERKLLHRTVPYALEERLLADVDDLHFALGAPTGEEVTVAVVARGWLDPWLGTLETETRSIEAIVPEPLLLDAAADEWALHIDAEQDRWVARLAGDRGFALAPHAARLALTAALRELAPPSRLLVSGTPLANIAELALPPLLAERAVAGRGFRGASGGGVVPLDLRQGRYQRRLPWRRWRREWRWPAAALVGAVVLQFAVGVFEHRQLRQENLALRGEIEQVYRSVEPRGALTDAEVQLRRRVAALAGSQQGGFLPLLAPVGDALSASEGVSLQTLNFSDARQELRLNLVATSFKEVETLRLAIANEGLTAQLVGTSSGEGKTRAQLLVAAPDGS